MVATLKRITTSPVIIQSGTAGHKDLKLVTTLVEQTLYNLPPARIRMNFIQYKKPRPGGKGLFDDFFTVFRRIPV